MLVTTLRDECQRLQLVLKEDNAAPSTHTDALGLNFSLEGQYVAPTQSSIEAVERALEAWTGANATGVKFMTWFGHVNWMNYTTGRVAFANFRAVMQLARRIAREQSWYSPLPLQIQQAIREARHLTSLLVRRKRTAVAAPQAVAVLWSDASTKGIAAVYECASGTTSATWAHPSSPERMYMTETMGGTRGGDSHGIPDSEHPIQLGHGQYWGRQIAAQRPFSFSGR